MAPYSDLCLNKYIKSSKSLFYFSYSVVCCFSTFFMFARGSFHCTCTGFIFLTSTQLWGGVGAVRRRPGSMPCNSAQWSSRFGFSCPSAQKQDTWQNEATTMAAYRPRILTSAPAHQRRREGGQQGNPDDEQMSSLGVCEGAFDSSYWDVIYTPAAI